jgi:mRNA interferase MazF
MFGFAKIRPVLVIQDDALTASGTPMVVILPLTTQVYLSFKLANHRHAPRSAAKTLSDDSPE